MKKTILKFLPILLLISVFSGCTKIGEKTASLIVVYSAAMILSVMLLAGYFFIAKKRDPWFILLFSSVVVVNAGYFSIASSSTLEEALLANRISYLGSVFLPLSMLMIILNVAEFKYKKWVPAALISIAFVVFAIAASPGYSDIYYKEVSLININGVSVLDKIYGPLHSIYLFYLLFYFAAMICAVIYSTAKKKLDSAAHTLVLISAVFVNIGVWLLEQLVKIDFELLSVSYIISELFLLGLSMLQEEHKKSFAMADPSSNVAENHPKLSKKQKEICKFFENGLLELTPTEKAIYGFYTEGKSTKEIREILNITENTLKYHNKNIYSKLGVSSRKELLEIEKTIKNENPPTT